MKKKLETVTEEIAACPIYKTMMLFQSKWSVWILFELSKADSVRFGELKKAIPGISNTMLSSTLKELHEKKLVARKQFNEIPPHVEYSSTDSAKALKEVFIAMEKWGDTYLE